MITYPGRILAIDYGSKRIGVAVSDPMRIIAQGVTTLDNDKGLVQNLSEIIRSQEAGLVVVGMPYSADGGKGAKAIEVEKFIANLADAVSVRIETWDESCSSVTAQRYFIDSGMRKKKRREKRRVDEMAARLFLQEYLDHHAKASTSI